MRRRVLLAVANVKVASTMAALAQVTQQVGTPHLHTTVETTQLLSSNSRANVEVDVS
jgi:hypothetical protein